MISYEIIPDKSTVRLNVSTQPLKSVFIRGPPASRVKIPILMYFFGFSVNLIRRLRMFGYRHAYSYYHWNKYDTVMMLLFAASFASWGWAWQEAMAHDDAWRHQARACWSSFEPTLWGEALFAAAACMAYIRVIYWYQVRRSEA